MCLIGKNVPQKEFFEWFNESMTYPTIKHIHHRLNSLSADDLDKWSVPVNQEVCMWWYSDMPYLQQILYHDRIRDSLLRGVFFAKIGQNY